MKDITLIILPCHSPNRPPLGLASLDSFLKSNGVSTHVLDFNIDCYNSSNHKELWDGRNFYEWTQNNGFDNILSILYKEFDSIINTLLKVDSKYIGFSVFSTNKPATKYVITSLRKAGIRSKIIVGGPQIRKEIDAEYFVENGLADISVYTDGEIPLLEIIQNKKHPSGSIFKQDNTIISTEKPKLKELVIPDFSFFDTSKYVQKNTLPFLFTRGCPNKCAYCEERMLFSGIKSFDENKFKDFIKYSIKNGVKKIIFSDSQINPSQIIFDRIINVLLSVNTALEFEANIFLFKWFSEQNIIMLKKCGFTKLTIGIESGSSKVLKDMNKNISLIHALRVSYWCLKHNIILKMNFIVGFPTERLIDFISTLFFITISRIFSPEINPVSSTCAALTGSDLYKHPEKYGIKKLHTLYFLSEHSDYKKRKLFMKIFNIFIKILGY